MKRILRAAAVAALLLTTVTPTALTTSTASGATAAPAGRTTVRLDIDGCRDSCDVQLIRLIEGHRRYWTSPEKTTQDGVVRFRVASWRTTGMTIAVSPRWHRNNYVPMVAVHYAGMSDGEVVTAQDAANKRFAYACLEGTRQPRMKLDVAVDRFIARGVTGEPVTTARVYTQEALPALAPRLRTRRGSVPAQDAIPCER
jgi:hypothetical protein